MGVKDFSRAERVADQIQREVAEIISRDLADPRVEAITVSAVRMSRDLSQATVFVTAHTQADLPSCVDVLNRAAGFVRRKLGVRMHMRYLPKIRFAPDDTLERAWRMDELISSVRGAGEERAGEPDDEDKRD